MIQLVLLLLGAQAVRRHWPTLALAGLGWIGLGLGIAIDPLDGVQDITMQTLGALLVLEGAVALLGGLLSDVPRRMLLLKGVALIVPGLLVAVAPLRSYVLVSMLFGLALLADGALRAASTLVVRFPGWRAALAGSAVEFVLAVLAFTPWPVSYQATVPFCVGVAFVLSGWSVLRSALLLRNLPEDAPVTSLPIFAQARGWGMVGAGGAERDPVPPEGQRLIVHVWTPRGTAGEARRRPLIDRYVAAVDRAGVVSTGHAALEMPPDLYISHYPADEIERDPADFRRMLQASADNDVPGRFLPSYRTEAAEWCEATVSVAFTRFDAARLRRFWAAYRRDCTYNLTNRNCSVAVAVALDAALEGTLGSRTMWPPLLRLVAHPHLHLATLLRQRAQTMTWTPGLVLDYARALHEVVEPGPVGWTTLIAQARRAWRAARRGQPGTDDAWEPTRQP